MFRRKKIELKTSVICYEVRRNNDNRRTGTVAIKRNKNKEQQEKKRKMKEVTEKI